jgi:hypothetical protein
LEPAAAIVGPVVGGDFEQVVAGLAERGGSVEFCSDRASRRGFEFGLLERRFSLANVTAPGPRNLDQVIVIGGPGGDFLAPSSTLASSATHTVKGSWVEVVAVNDLAMPAVGPCTVLPTGSNMRNGGVMCMRSSLRGDTSHKGFKLPGMDVSLPLATIVQVICLSLKSLGTVTVKTLQRPG